MGWKDDPVVSSSWQDDPVVEEKKKRTTGEELARQGGLTARYGLEGPMGLFNAAIGDPVNTAINYGIRGINQFRDKPLPQLGMPSEATGRLLTQAGLPQPETPTENVVGAISKGLAGGGPVTGLAQRAAANAGPILKGGQYTWDYLRRAMPTADGLVFNSSTQAPPIARSIAAAPVTDILSSGVGAGASDLTREAGGGLAAQMAAGALAPMGLGAGASAIKMAAGVPNELRRPLTKGGAEQIAADVLGKMTQDKQRALENLHRYNTLVDRGEQVGAPGYKPTSGAVAGDYGLVGGQQLLSRGDANPLFAARQASNNEALATDLGRLNATDKAIALYEKKRDDITGPLRDKAFAPTETVPGTFVQHHVDYTPVAEKIGELAATPAGGKAESQKALHWIAQRLAKHLDESRTDPANAYALYQDIGDLIKGKIKDTNGSALMLAGGLANDVKRTLGTQIEEAAPGFKNYLEHYARLSKPIDRLEVIKERLGGQDLTKVTNAMPQVTDQGATFTVSQAKMKNVLQNINDETRLAPRQRDVLERVLGNLNSESFASRAGKQPGSDTYQNIASANFMSRVLGDTLAGSGLGKTVGGALGLAYRPLESRINDMIVEAFQDPRKMEELLRKARTRRGSPSLTGLADFATPRVGGGLLGAIIQ